MRTVDVIYQVLASGGQYVWGNEVTAWRLGRYWLVKTDCIRGYSNPHAAAWAAAQAIARSMIDGTELDPGSSVG